MNPLDRDRLILQVGIFILGFMLIAGIAIIVAALYPQVPPLAPAADVVRRSNRFPAAQG